MTKKEELRKQAAQRIAKFAQKEMEQIDVGCDWCSYSGSSGRCYDCDNLTFPLFFDDENNAE